MLGVLMCWHPRQGGEAPVWRWISVVWSVFWVWAPAFLGFLLYIFVVAMAERKVLYGLSSFSVQAFLSCSVCISCCFTSDV